MSHLFYEIQMVSTRFEKGPAEEAGINSIGIVNTNLKCINLVWNEFPITKTDKLKAKDL